MRKALLVLLAAAALAVPAVAAADSCANFSRPAPACNLSCTSVVFVGNWIWLPSLTNIGVPASELPAAWGFESPENFTNGQTESLQGVSALCNGSIALFKRQDGVFAIAFGGGGAPDFSLLKGIWSGCE